MITQLVKGMPIHSSWRRGITTGKSSNGAASTGGLDEITLDFLFTATNTLYTKSIWVVYSFQSLAMLTAKLDLGLLGRDCSGF
jgi:hypothetical protein